MSVWGDILAQAENLRRVIGGHSGGPAEELARAGALLQAADRVVFTGVGSGLNATLPAAYYLMAHGKPAFWLDATEAVYGLLPGLAGGTLVLNTRSGETVELVRLAEQARQAGVPTVAVTNEPGSTVGRLAQVCLPTHSRWDELVVISAYGGMLATELVLAGQVLGKYGQVLDELQAASRALEDVLQQAIELREEMARLFEEARPIYLLGRGPSLASALGGELALEEMSRRPAIAMAAGLFRQGPVEVVDERFRAVIFEGAGEQARLNASLGKTLLANGAGVLWVGAQTLEGALNISLPELPDTILPLLEIVPCYVLAYDLAARQGITPGSVRFIQKVIKEETL